MSTFAVLGVTRRHAYSIAAKSTPTIDHGMVIPESEWTKRVASAAVNIFTHRASVQLSHAYDAPQFAYEFIKLAHQAGGVRELEVRARRPIQDAQGKPILGKKGGKPKMEWVVYAVPGRAA